MRQGFCGLRGFANGKGRTTKVNPHSLPNAQVTGQDLASATGLSPRFSVRTSATLRSPILGQKVAIKWILVAPPGAAPFLLDPQEPCLSVSMSSQ